MGGPARSRYFFTIPPPTYTAASIFKAVMKNMIHFLNFRFQRTRFTDSIVIFPVLSLTNTSQDGGDVDSDVNCVLPPPRSCSLRAFKITPAAARIYTLSEHVVFMISATGKQLSRV